MGGVLSRDARHGKRNPPELFHVKQKLAGQNYPGKNNGSDGHKTRSATPQFHATNQMVSRCGRALSAIRRVARRRARRKGLSLFETLTCPSVGHARNLSTARARLHQSGSDLLEIVMREPASRIPRKTGACCKKMDCRVTGGAKPRCSLNSYQAMPHLVSVKAGSTLRMREPTLLL